MFSFGTAHALRFMGGPKWMDDQNYNGTVLLGMPGFTNIECKGNENNDELLLFEIGFDKEANKIDAFWSMFDDDKSENREGVIIIFTEYDHGKYLYRVTLNTDVIRKKIEKKNGPINFFFGCYNPKSGYPNFKEVRINLDNKIPKNERMKCPKIDE